MRGRRFFMLAGLAGPLLLVAVEAQGANDIARVDNVGWWSKRLAAQPIPGATSFEVASGIDGDESVAALRILVSGSVTKSTLVISEVANMGTGAISAPKLQVCRTDAPWVLTTNPGKFADAPTPSCDGAAALARDDLGNWRADVTSMLAGNRSEVSLMVVPAPDHTLPIPPTFIIDIAASRVETEGTPDVVDAPAPPITELPTTTIRVGNAFPTPPPGPIPITPTGNVAAPVTTTTAPLGIVSPRLGGNLITKKSKGKDWGKLILLVPLSAIAAFGWVFARKFAIERGVLAPN